MFPPLLQLNLKERIWHIVETEDTADRLSDSFHALIITLIIGNILAVILGSVPSVQQQWGFGLALFEAFSVTVFIIELAARVWSCSVNPRYAGVRGRVRYFFSPMVIIDWISILPSLLFFINFDLRVLRAFRLLRVVRLVR